MNPWQQIFVVWVLVSAIFWAIVALAIIFKP